MSSTFSSCCARQLGVGVGARHERVEVVDGSGSSSTSARPSRRSAGRARRAGCAARRSSRSGPRACAARRPRTRAGRRGTWGRCGPWRCRRRCGRRGRCAAGRAVTDFGDSTCSTRSTAPMSMPSSSDEVATRHGSSPALSCVLDHEPLLARQRAVVRARRSRRRAVRVRRGQLVEAQRQPLGAAAVVDEHDRRPVLADELEDLGVDRRPDRLARRLRRPRAGRARRRTARARPSTRRARGSSGRAACARRRRRSGTCASGRP